MDTEIERKIVDNIRRYGAEGILVERVTLGSQDDLSKGKGRNGYSVRTIDSLSHRSFPHSTRMVCNLEAHNFEESMRLISRVARSNGLALANKAEV